MFSEVIEMALNAVLKIACLDASRTRWSDPYVKDL